MKKGFIARFLALFLVAVMLPYALPAARADDPNEVVCWSFEEGFWSWFYLPSTVPQGYLDGSSETAIKMYSVAKGQEAATSARIDFVSGDEHLKDVFFVGQIETWDGESCLGWDLKLEQLEKPGHAMFHLDFVSEHYHYEKDITLWVLSWEEDPLFEIEQKTDLVTISTIPGGVIAVEALKGSVSLVDHSGEIAEKLSAEGETVVSKPEIRADYFFGESSGERYNEEEGYPKRPRNGSLVDELYANEYPGLAVSFRLNEPGTYHVFFSVNTSSNIFFYTDAAIVQVLPYVLKGPGTIAPGASAKYTITDTEPNSGRSFTLSLEGKGVTLTEDSASSGACTVTADEDAENGASFTLTATPSDGGAPAVLNGTVKDGVITGIAMENMEFPYGSEFSVPVFSTATGEYESGAPTGYMNALLSYPRSRENLTSWPSLVYITGAAPFFPDREAEETYLKECAAERLGYIYLGKCEKTVETEEIRDVQGRPVLIGTGTLSKDGKVYPFGCLLTIRNNTSLMAELVVDGNSSDPDELPRVTSADMLRLAEGIVYNESEADLTRADGEITVSAKNGETVIIGGKKVQLTASFANKDKVNKKAKNDTVEWSVIDLENGETPTDVTIDKNGSLTAKKDLAVVRKLQVKAVSTTFFTEGTYEITAIPVVKKVTLDPAELFFYVGTDEAQTVKAMLDPDTVPPTGITWTPAKKDLLEIEAADDGTARIRPLAGGKTTVAVKEPGGKNAKLTVSVVEPVTEVTLTAKGKVKPGNTVTVTATLAPKNAGNRNLEWSLDVDESIASIDTKGKVKIAKTAASGTVITVSCKALGAPEPVIATLAITVE